MIDEKLISQIQTVLSKEPNIRLAYVLGSSLSGKARTDSDFDLAVVVDSADKVADKDIYQLIFPLKFPKDLDLSIVDDKSSPLFLFQITSTGKCVYQKSLEDKISFEAFVMDNYYDTAHLRNIYFSYLRGKFPYAG